MGALVGPLGHTPAEQMGVILGAYWSHPGAILASTGVVIGAVLIMLTNRTSAIAAGLAPKCVDWDGCGCYCAAADHL